MCKLSFNQNKFLVCVHTWRIKFDSETQMFPPFNINTYATIVSFVYDMIQLYDKTLHSHLSLYG